MTTINMVPSNAGEVCDLLEILSKHGVHCSLEFKADHNADPLISLVDEPIAVKYIEGDLMETGDLVEITLGGADFTFSLGDHEFFQLVQGAQVTVLITGPNYAAWFNSQSMPSEAIFELTACNSAFILDDDEFKLIEYVRGLKFDDVLDAVKGILDEAQKAAHNAARCNTKGEEMNYCTFMERTEALQRLATFLGDANRDYRSHINAC
ncbi:hypothetical protein [Paenibacillus gansuensis]|uniref:Uncharacterized protein n=1 Tax=Paenibacillus gansuensis TaxID=306542 RepID=A0ABW5PGU4_9BACL